MKTALPNYTFYSPADYQPGVFAQSVSGVCAEGVAKADRFCVFWSLFFLFEATRSSPREVVELLEHDKRTGQLRKVTRTTCRATSEP